MFGYCDRLQVSCCQYALVGVASHLVLFGNIQNQGLRSHLTCHFATYEVYWLLAAGLLFLCAAHTSDISYKTYHSYIWNPSDPEYLPSGSVRLNNFNIFRIIRSPEIAALGSTTKVAYKNGQKLDLHHIN